MRRPTEGPGATSPSFLTELLRKQKMSKFHFFRPSENLVDHGRHRKPVLQAVFNRGADYLTIKNPVIFYSE